MNFHKRNQNAILASTVLFAITAGLLLPGCGSSDPTKQYASVKNEAVAPGQAAAATKDSFDSRNILNIDALTQYMYFYEGKPGTFYFAPNLQIGGVKYTIQQAGLPGDQGIMLTAATDKEHKDQVALSWSPKYGTLGSDSKREYNFILTLVPAADTDLKAMAILNGINPARSFSFVLLKSDETPTFEKADNVQGAIEGKRQTFSIVVKDVSAAGNRQPSLVAFADSNMTTAGAIPKFNAEPEIFVRGQAQPLGDNLFKFDVMFDGSSITMPSGNSSAMAHVVFRVTSSSGIESMDKIIEFPVSRKASSPTQASAPAAVAPTVVTSAVAPRTVAPVVKPVDKVAVTPAVAPIAAAPVVAPAATAAVTPAVAPRTAAPAAKAPAAKAATGPAVKAAAAQTATPVASHDAKSARPRPLAQGNSTQGGGK